MVELPQPIYAEMLEHVRRGYPNEACGILAGANGKIIKHYPTANAADEPETFSIIAAQDLLNIWNEIEGHEWDVFAYYHSHPRTQAYPSPRDIAYAQGWPGTYYLIFTLKDGPEQPGLRAFLIQNSAVQEEETHIIR